MSITCGCDLALLDELFVGLDRDLRDILAAILVEKLSNKAWLAFSDARSFLEAARLSREIMQLSQKGWMCKCDYLAYAIIERNSAFEETVVARISRNPLL